MEVYKNCEVDFEDGETFYTIYRNGRTVAGGPCINKEDGLRIAKNYIDMFL